MTRITTFADMSILPTNERTLTLGDSLTMTDNINAPTHPEALEQARAFLAQLPKRMPKLGLLLVVNGEISMRINLTDYIIKSGQVLIVSAGAIFEHVDFSYDLQVLHFSVDQKNLPSLVRLNESHLHRLYAIQAVCISLSDHCIQMLLEGYNLMRKIIEFPNFKNKEEAAFSCMNMMGFIIAQGEPIVEGQTPQAPSRKHEIAARFLKSVQDNYRQHRDLGFYSDQLCLSLKYMSRVVFEQTGRHPSQWIKDYVILDAKSMLRSGRYTVQQVADELNFPNQSFFGKYFKEAVGMSPRRWTNGG